MWSIFLSATLTRFLRGPLFTINMDMSQLIVRWYTYIVTDCYRNNENNNSSNVELKHSCDQKPVKDALV